MLWGLWISLIVLGFSYDECKADYKGDDSLDLGGAKGKAQINLKQTEFSVGQFALRMGRTNISVFKE